jgi:hypothetical protein
MSDKKPWWQEPFVVLWWREVASKRRLRQDLRSLRHECDAYKAEACVQKRRAATYRRMALEATRGNPRATDAVLMQIQSDELADLPERRAPRSAP